MQAEQKFTSEKCVCYIRLSADDSNNPSFSPANQEKICKDHAKNLGMKISSVYRDINRSGANLDRPGFQKLLQDAKAKLFNALIIKDWSRLTRDIADLRQIRKKVEKDLGIKIISCDGVSDDKAIDVSTLSSDWYIQESRKKQQQVHDLKLKELIPLNRPPYGYRMSKKLKKFIIKEEEAQDVKSAFEMKYNSASITQIADELKLKPTTVYHILQNKTYLGFNKYKGNWFKGKHEAIIDEETFNKCQDPNSRKGGWTNSKPVKTEL